MTGREFKAIRKSLFLTREGMGQRLGPSGRPYSRRAVQSWELGENVIPPAVELLMQQWITAD